MAWRNQLDIASLWLLNQLLLIPYAPIKNSLAQLQKKFVVYVVLTYSDGRHDFQGMRKISQESARTFLNLVS